MRNWIRDREHGDITLTCRALVAIVAPAPSNRLSSAIPSLDIGYMQLADIDGLQHWEGNF